MDQCMVKPALLWEPCYLLDKKPIMWVNCMKSKDRHTIGRSCLFWSSVFAMICLLKIFLICIYSFLTTTKTNSCLSSSLLPSSFIIIYFSCTWRRQFSVESACVSLFPCVSLYRWITFPYICSISFVNLTSSCSFIPQKKNVLFHMR